MDGANDRKVLVIDDDPDIRESMLEILADSGYASLGAANGVEALAVLREQKVMPRVILLDLMMPIMDGFGFRTEQLNDPTLREIPVVVISANRDAEQSAQRIGANAVFKKPIDLKKLLEVIERFCPRV